MGLEEFSTDSISASVTTSFVLGELKEYAKEHSDQKWLNGKWLAKEPPITQRKITYYLQRSDEVERWIGETPLVGVYSNLYFDVDYLKPVYIG